MDSSWLADGGEMLPLGNHVQPPQAETQQCTELEAMPGEHESYQTLAYAGQPIHDDQWFAEYESFLREFQGQSPESYSAIPDANGGSTEFVHMPCTTEGLYSGHPHSYRLYEKLSSGYEDLFPAELRLSIEYESVFPGNLNLSQSYGDLLPKRTPSLLLETEAPSPENSGASPRYSESGAQGEQVGDQQWVAGPSVYQQPKTRSSGSQGSDEPKALQCEYCDLSFDEKRFLTKHEKTHTLPFKCRAAGCGERFALKESLTRHINSKHRKGAAQQRWYCPVTDCRTKLSREGTSRRDTLERHIRDQHGRNELMRWQDIRKSLEAATWSE